jgi:predicted Fe-Mo cluster-binding NifX family protein
MSGLRQVLRAAQVMNGFQGKGKIMKIAISSTGPDLDAEVDPRFGRCPCFVVVDPTNEAVEILDNQAATMSGGAGIQAAQMVANSGAVAVITGNLGPNAADTLAASGLRTYLGVSGTVRGVLQQYVEGRLEEAGSPSADGGCATTPPTAGTGMGAGMGRGPTGGRGMGCRRGGGSGRGMGRSRSMGRNRSMDRGVGSRLEPVIESDRQPAPMNDLEELKRQKDQLRKQMNRIEEKIRNLEKKK